VTPTTIPTAAAAIDDPTVPQYAFSLTLTDQNGQGVTDPFAVPVQLSVQMVPPSFKRFTSWQGSLYLLDPTAQTYGSVTSSFDPTTNILTASLSHFSDYLAAMGGTSVIMPTVDGYATDLCQGTASVRIPLKVPPGPHGFEPKLELTYSSGGPNGVISEEYTTYENSQGSWVGFGWELNLGYVMVTAWVNPPSNQQATRGYLVLNNKSYDLIYDTTTSAPVLSWYAQTNEFDWIREIRAYDPNNPSIYRDYFLVRTKDGIEYRFGYEAGYLGGTNFYDSGSDNSRMDAAGGAGWTPVRWNLDQITDTFGNQIAITYTSQSNQQQWGYGLATFDKWCYPKEIHYNLKDAGTYRRKIAF
jgi:hypothetical protein